jgi:hypothetical protein
MENITIKEFILYVLPLWIGFILLAIFPIPVISLVILILVYNNRR